MSSKSQVRQLASVLTRVRCTGVWVFGWDGVGQVSSRFVQCSSGLEIVGKARQLASHFDTVGTPIMMGGGSLAYTLLGVDYNSSTGDARFLILVRCPWCEPDQARCR